MKEYTWVLKKDRECRWCHQVFQKGSSVAVFLGHFRHERRIGQTIYAKPGETVKVTLDRNTTIEITYPAGTVLDSPPTPTFFDKNAVLLKPQPKPIKKPKKTVLVLQESKSLQESTYDVTFPK